MCEGAQDQHSTVSTRSLRTVHHVNPCKRERGSVHDLVATYSSDLGRNVQIYCTTRVASMVSGPYHFLQCIYIYI